MKARKTGEIGRDQEKTNDAQGTDHRPPGIYFSVAGKASSAPRAAEGVLNYLRQFKSKKDHQQTMASALFARFKCRRAPVACLDTHSQRCQRRCRRLLGCHSQQFLRINVYARPRLFRQLQISALIHEPPGSDRIASFFANRQTSPQH